MCFSANESRRSQRAPMVKEVRQEHALQPLCHNRCVRGSATRVALAEVRFQPQVGAEFRPARKCLRASMVIWSDD